MNNQYSYNEDSLHIIRDKEFTLVIQYYGLDAQFSLFLNENLIQQENFCWEGGIPSPQDFMDYEISKIFYPEAHSIHVLNHK